MIKPLGQRVLIKLDAERRETASGLILPDTASEPPQTATVLALGVGDKDASGNLIGFSVAVGDRVVTTKYGPVAAPVSDTSIKLVHESDIIAIVTEDN